MGTFLWCRFMNILAAGNGSVGEKFHLQHCGAVQLHTLREIYSLIAKALLPDRKRLIDGCSICILVSQNIQPRQYFQMGHLQSGSACNLIEN